MVRAARIAAALLLLLLGGCLTFGRIDARGTTINESIGAMGNRAILLNLVRASRSEPLYFLSLNQVQAQGAADLKLGAPSFNEGPGLTQSQKLFAFNTGGSTFLDNSTNTNMQVSVYNTQAFYLGMLQPLGLDEVDILLHQGFPRELIFYLIIDRVKLTDQQTGASRIIYNDPADPTYPTFVSAIRAAMDHGLTTEVLAKDEHGERGSHEAPTAPLGTAATTGPVIVEVTQPPGGAEKGPPPHAELCIERALAPDVSLDEFAELSKEGKPPKFCGARHAERSPSAPGLTVRLFGRDTEVEVTTRSVYRTFFYLGGIIDMAAPDVPRLIDYGADYRTRRNDVSPPERTLEGPLIDITDADARAGGCFTAVNYSGRSYCVPEQGSKITRDIFSILSVLVALKQSPGDLPATQTVLIAP
jgi:hypothetical protein